MGGVLIVGASSGIAKALAHALAGRGHDLVLLGRDEAELSYQAHDLAIRHGVKAHVVSFDALAFDTHVERIDAAVAAVGALDGAVVALGYLGDQALGQSDWEEARRILDTNMTGCVSVTSAIAAHLERQGRGFLCGLSSVAGDRGRPSNYLYGAAKAGYSAYLSGLRARLSRSGVKVLTIKPGFVDTGMTYGKPGMFLVASPESAAKGIAEAIDKGRDVAYVPGFWALVMGIIRAVPEPVFKRMKS